MVIIIPDSRFLRTGVESLKIRCSSPCFLGSLSALTDADQIGNSSFGGNTKKHKGTLLTQTSLHLLKSWREHQVSWEVHSLLVSFHGRTYTKHTKFLN